MADQAATILHTLARWLVTVSQTLAGWDTTSLIAATIILGVLAGIAGRAAAAPRLHQQIIWGLVAAVLALIQAVVIWTIASRYLPITGIDTLLQHMLHVQGMPGIL